MKDYRVNVAIAVLIALPCFGQKSANDYITIVGKQHPELIDDATAWWHLFRVLSTRSQADTDEMFIRRRMSFARKTGLPANQIAHLPGASDSFEQENAGFRRSNRN